MKKRIFIGTVILVMVFSLLSSCLKDDTLNTDNSSASGISADNTAVKNAESISKQYSSDDTDSSFDESSATKVTLSGTSITVDGSGSVANGSTLTINSGGIYILSGTLSNGQILVSASETDDVQLVLDGVNITCDTSAPIYASSADKLIITIKNGTVNSVTDGGDNFEYTDTAEEEPNAAVFAKCDLTINGSGSLTVNANFNNGIGTKDDLVIANGNLVINAKNDGIRGRDSITILDGTFQVTAGGDGIQSNNSEDTSKGWILLEGGTYNITAANDGIQAETILSVTGGTYSIKTSGGANGGSSSGTDSYKGLKATTDLVISGGGFNIDSADDCIHANSSIVISGGDYTLTSGDDGIHADNDLSITGGNIDITKSYEGIEGAAITISNGTINIVSSDDAINAAGGDDGGIGGMWKDSFSSSESYYINISGGSIYFTAGGDGIDSNGTVNISGGTVTALIKSSADNGAIDCDGTFTATGGTIIYGGTGMGNTPAGSSTQSYVFISSGFSSDTVVTVKKDNEILAEVTLNISCQYLTFSTPDIKSGESYEIYSGSSLLSTVTAGTGGISGRMGGGPGGGRK